MVLGSGVAVGCGIGCRWGLDPVLPWLFYAWELPYVTGIAEKRKKNDEGMDTEWLSIFPQVFFVTED